MQFASYGPLENHTQQPHVLLRAHSKSAKALRTEPRNYRLLLQPLQHQQQRRMKVSELPCGHKYNSRAVFLLVWACRHMCNCYIQNPLPFSQDFLLGKASICANKLKASIHPSMVHATSSDLWLKVFLFQEKHFQCLSDKNYAQKWYLSLFLKKRNFNNKFSTF